MQHELVDGLAVARWGGTGPTMVLLHAGVTDSRGWYDLAALLDDVGPRVAFDRRGHGRTPPGSAPYLEVDDLLSVLDAVTAEPAWLVASSWGARSALDAAVDHPERVAGLVLLAPSVAGAPEPDVDARTAELDELVEAATDNGDLTEANRLEAQLWLDGPACAEGRVQGPARELFLAMNATILAQQDQDASAPGRPDTWQHLGELRVPVTVAWGELDVPCLVDRWRLLLEVVPHGTGRALAGTAHLPYLERPDLVAAVVREAVAVS